IDRTLVAHLLPHLQAAGYDCWPDRPHPHRRYYELIAIRKPLKRTSEACLELDSDMGRELLIVDAEQDGVRWRLMTAHMESLAQGRLRRQAQAAVILEQMGEGPALFGGDTNLRDDEVEAMPDAWAACGSPDKLYMTYRSRSGARRRYDRFWGRGVRFSGFSLVGQTRIAPGGPMPSDHLGIGVSMKAAE
ncbi:MAG: hypothetical protein AAFV53_05790, partial [Myxococcota bacterium]